MDPAKYIMSELLLNLRMGWIPAQVVLGETDNQEVVSSNPGPESFIRSFVVKNVRLFEKPET